MQGVIFSYYV